MKRLILFSFALMVILMSHAMMVAPADFRVVCKDGSVAYYSGLYTTLTFSEDASLLYITTGFPVSNDYSYEDGYVYEEGSVDVVCYAVDGIEAIEFAHIQDSIARADSIAEALNATRIHMPQGK